MNNIGTNLTENHARVFFDAKSENESFARMIVMGFMANMNPTLDELEDVKTAVSEAVTNAIIHGYEVENEESNFLPKSREQVELFCVRESNKLTVSVRDRGVGIENVDEARQPFFTTKPDMERTGMGFAFMESFMDEVQVESTLGEGTCVTMTKYIGQNKNELERAGEQ